MDSKTVDGIARVYGTDLSCSPSASLIQIRVHRSCPIALALVLSARGRESRSDVNTTATGSAGPTSVCDESAPEGSGSASEPSSDSLTVPEHTDDDATPNDGDTAGDGDCFQPSRMQR